MAYHAALNSDKYGDYSLKIYYDIDGKQQHIKKNTKFTSKYFKYREIPYNLAFSLLSILIVDTLKRKTLAMLFLAMLFFQMSEGSKLSNQ